MRTCIFSKKFPLSLSTDIDNCIRYCDYRSFIVLRLFSNSNTFIPDQNLLRFQCTRGVQFILTKSLYMSKTITNWPTKESLGQMFNRGPMNIIVKSAGPWSSL